MKQNCNSYTTTNSGGCACGCREPAQENCGCRPPVQECCDCGCRPKDDCGCCPGQVQPADVDCGCDCAPGMLAALQLLCEPRLAPLVDFSQFAFVTKNFVLGTSLSCPTADAAEYDNLTGPLDGELVGLNTGTCDRLEVTGPIYYPIPVCRPAISCCAAGPGFDARSIDLCSICAVAFSASDTPYPLPIRPQPQPEPAAPEADDPAPAAINPVAAAYRQARAQLWQRLRPGRPPMPGPFIKPTPCDNGAGSDCSGLECRRTVSLTAGALLVSNAAVLGSVGDVLVLGNEEDYRFYFVCKSCIGFVD